MGVCASQGADAALTLKLDSQIRKEQYKDENIVKLLLLGAGESGKVPSSSK